MKKINLKRVLAILLSLCMCLPLVTVPTFAADPLTLPFEANFDSLDPSVVNKDADLTANNGANAGYTNAPTGDAALKNVDKNAMGTGVTHATFAFSELKTEEGRGNYLRVPYYGLKHTNATGGAGNFHNNGNYLKISLGSATLPGDYLVLETMYRFHAEGGVAPTFQAQLGFTTIDKGASTDQAQTWLELFKVDGLDGTFKTVGEKAFTHVDDDLKMIPDEWNHVKTVINLKAGTVDIYLNGSLLAKDAVLYASGSEVTNIRLKDTSIFALAKPDRKSAAAVSDLSQPAGYIDVDDIKISAPATYDCDAEIKANVIKTLDKASIRLSDPIGLRFVTEINTRNLVAIKNMKNADDSAVKSVEIGTLITLKSISDAAGAVTFADLDTYATAQGTVAYVNVKATEGAWYTNRDGSNLPALTDGHEYFAGSIINIKTDHLTEEMIGRGYVKVTYQDNSVEYIYSEAFHTATVKSIAQSAYDNIETNGLGDFADALIDLGAVPAT